MALMSLSTAVPLLMLLSSSPEPRWEEAAKKKGITVYFRQRAGSSVSEVKAVGLVDAPPSAVWKVIRDYPNYPKQMPYVEESRVVASEEEGKVLAVYCVINAPFVDRRDYVIRVRDESDWRDGKGFMKSTWTTANELTPKPKNDVVRVKIAEGHWLLEPRENGQKTFATYYLNTDPGGSLPKWIVNRANSSAIPDVFEAVRKYSVKK